MRHVAMHQDMRLGQKIVYVHNSEKHSMEQVVKTFRDKKYTNCLVAIKDDFVFSCIITTNIKKTLESTNARLYAAKRHKISQPKLQP